MESDVGSENVEILLDSDSNSYQIGDTITGRVIIKLLGEHYGDLELTYVNIRLRGMSEIKWREQPGLASEGHQYHLEEQYLNVSYEFPNVVGNSVINKGIHEIPFSFQLPESGIPSTLHTEYGYINYWIEVLIEDDTYSTEQFNARKQIRIEAPLRHGLYLSVGGGTEKDIGLLFFGSGKVRIDATITRKGFILGDIVEVNCLVANNSTVSVTPRVSLFQTQIFMAKEKHKTIEVAMKPVIGSEVISNETIEQTLLVPIPTDISLSIKTRLITIKYFIHVTLDIPYSVDLHLNLPIIITNQYALNQ